MREAGPTGYKHCFLLWPMGSEQREFVIQTNIQIAVALPNDSKQRLVSLVCEIGLILFALGTFRLVNLD